MARRGTYIDIYIYPLNTNQIDPDRQVKALDLSGNNVSASALAQLAKFLPDVARLSLRHGNIQQWSDLDPISYGALPIDELILLDNLLSDVMPATDYKKCSFHLLNLKLF